MKPLHLLPVVWTFTDSFPELSWVMMSSVPKPVFTAITEVKSPPRLTNPFQLAAEP